jgi:hypothetical protein
MIEDAPDRAFREPNGVLRIAMAAVMGGGLVWLAVAFSGLVIADETVLQVSIATALVAAAGAILIRRQALDGIGLVGVMLTMAGLGTAACMALGQSPPGPKANSALILTLAWLAIGATALTQFFRRLGLPAVGPEGLVKPNTE